MSSNATENIREVEKAIEAARESLYSVDAPFTIWAPGDVRFALEQDFYDVTDEMVWEVWEAMPKSRLSDVHDGDWAAFEDAVDQGVQGAGI